MAHFFYQRISQFAETDAAGIIHFSHIACYAEEAEHAFLKHAGYPIEMHNIQGYRWPRVKYTAHYLKPVLPFEPLVVMLRSGRVGRTSILWHWTLFDRKQETVFSHGEMKSICCLADAAGIHPCMIPDNLRQHLLKN